MILITGSMLSPHFQLDAELLLLILERVDAMTDGGPFDPDLHGLIAVVEPGDNVSDLVEAVGHDFLSDHWTGARFGDPEFNPIFEVLEEHTGSFELVIVPGDGDYGIVIFIPKEAGVHPLLMCFCQMYASPAP